MRSGELKISYKEFGSVEELPEADRALVLAARKSSEKAYAPYSKFRVGAALLLENGETVEGNNQENADFTDGLCAERVALFYAHSKFPDVAVKTIAISASNSNGLLLQPAKPCGSCRQVMVETEVRFKRPMRILLDGAEGILLIEGAASLLPFAFTPGSLD